MCGLCGFTTHKDFKLTKSQLEKRAKAIECLLVANESRGTHSTGIALIEKEGLILKRATTASLFIQEEIIRKALRYPIRSLIGHTRTATMGAISAENAHPFKEGSIIGAHNGVISNYETLDSTVNVDSQAVIRTLNVEKNDYKKAFAKTRGSCALTWVDLKDTNVLYMVSHNNPIAVARIPEIQTIFWSSQWDHLKPIMTAFFGGHPIDLFSLKQDKVYKINHNLTIKGDSVLFDSYQSGIWNPEEFKRYMDYEARWKKLRRMRDDDNEDYDHCDINQDDFPENDQQGIIKLIGDGKKEEILSFKDFDPEDWEVLLKRSAEEGCALCGTPMWLDTYYDEDQGTLFCQECFKTHPELENIVAYVDFSMAL